MGGWSNSMKKNRVELPKLISDKYVLLKKATSFGQSSSIKGIYLDKKTKALVFVKINSNGTKLSDEYENQKFFYSVSKKLSRGIYIPKPIKIIKIGKVWALVMEYIKGEALLKVDSQTQLRIYIKVLKFLKEINRHTYFDKKHILPKKSAAWQLFTLPYFLLKNLICYPSPILFLFSARVIISKISQWMQIKSGWISHGDINVTNILISGKRIFILDFAHSCLSHKYFDMAQMLNSSWRKRGFHDKFLTLLVQEFNLSETSEKLLKSFVIFNLMQRLSQKYKNPNQANFYLRRLETMKISHEKNNYQEKLNQLLQQLGFRPTPAINGDGFNRFNGIITDKFNKKYFIKVAFGKNSYQYKSLFWESQITKNLSKITRKIHITYDGYRLYIPKVLKTIKQDDFCLLITNYIKGKRLKDQSENKQADIVLGLLQLLEKLDNVSEISQIRPYLKDYTRLALCFSLPMRLLKGIFLYPSVSFGLIRAFCKALSLLLPRSYEYGIVHPDINVTNIIFRKNAIFLTDWEEAGWGIKAINMITPLFIHFQNKKLKDLLLEKLENDDRNKSTPLFFYRILMLFNQQVSKNNYRQKRDLMLLKSLETIK